MPNNPRLNNAIADGSGTSVMLNAVKFTGLFIDTNQMPDRCDELYVKSKGVNEF